MTRRLEGRIAVISGAAGGLGKAAAIRLANEGAKIEILDIRDASETVSQIREAGGEANAALCDCTDEKQIATAVAAIDARHGRIDILVNNAGILTARKPWLTLTKEEVQR